MRIPPWFALMLCSLGPMALRAEPAPSSPLVIGEQFELHSATLDEQRHINVYFPPGYDRARPARLPLLLMPDGGLDEDFLHVAGLLQVGVANGTMRPMLLVGVANTERRRDMTGPTENAEDRKIAPRVGGSAAFRRFLRTELLPELERRYALAPQRAIVGESLAGLFVVETFLREPDLFDTCIAVDPSLWWNNARLLEEAPELLRQGDRRSSRLFLAASSQAELRRGARQLESILAKGRIVGLQHEFRAFPDETHATVYHPAALVAFRHLMAPTPAATR